MSKSLIGRRWDALTATERDALPVFTVLREPSGEELELCDDRVWWSLEADCVVPSDEIDGCAIVSRVNAVPGVAS